MQKIITGDEMWCFQHDPKRSKWLTFPWPKKLHVSNLQMRTTVIKFFSIS